MKCQLTEAQDVRVDDILYFYNVKKKNNKGKIYWERIYERVSEVNKFSDYIEIRLGHIGLHFRYDYLCTVWKFK